MNLEKRFLQIKQILIEHRSLLEKEVLEQYPNSPSPYTNWAQELLALSASELIQLENTLNTPKALSEDYQNLLKKIKSLTELPKPTIKTTKMAPNFARKISLKKRHEIELINSQLAQLTCENFIDIGSGAGHLSSFLLQNNTKTSTCLDKEKAYQDIGKKKLQRYYPEILKRINFMTADFQDIQDISCAQETTVIGLHACGALSKNIIDFYLNSEAKYLLNYGCCFHKMNADNFNLSTFAKSQPLELTNHELTMAAKSYKNISQATFEQREKVKLYRYVLHMYLYDHFKSGFTSIGNTHSSDYQKDFAHYAKKYSLQLKQHDSKKLNFFFQTKKDLAKFYIRLGIIRSHFSRLIEIYLILDRALYLKENQTHVSVTETFDRKISPRNLSLMAYKF